MILEAWRNAPNGQRIGFAVGLLSLIAAVITIFTFMTNKTLPEVVAQPAPSASSSSPIYTPTPTPSSASAPESGIVTPSVKAASQTKADPTREGLLLEDAVGLEKCDQGNISGPPWEAQPMIFNEIKYKNGIGCKLYGAQAGTVDFLRPSWAGRLWITAGVPDDSRDSTPQIEVTISNVVSGEVLHEQEVRIGEPVIAELAVTDHMRVRVSMKVMTEDKYLRLNGGLFGFTGEWRP